MQELVCSKTLELVEQQLLRYMENVTNIMSHKHDCNYIIFLYSHYMCSVYMYTYIMLCSVTEISHLQLQCYTCGPHMSEIYTYLTDDL